MKSLRQSFAPLIAVQIDSGEHRPREHPETFVQRADCLDFAGFRRLSERLRRDL